MDLLQPSGWSQFGLAGAVIAALFGALWRMLSTHSEERQQMREEHLVERSEWKGEANQRAASSSEREKDLYQVLRGLEATIREVGEKQ